MQRKINSKNANIFSVTPQKDYFVYFKFGQK
jgi:hypothetical protein